MSDEGYLTRSIARKPRGIVTITGQDVKIRVRRHQLEITDGFPLEARQETRGITRATSRMERVLFLAGSGFVTVDALDFCGLENSIPIIALTQSGALRWTLMPGAGGAYQAALRRAQALAPFTNTGLRIANWLVARKVAGQRDALRDLADRARVLKDAWPKCTIPEALAALETILPRVERAATIPALRQIEAEAADAYWSGWVGLPLHFAPPSYRKRVPEFWTSFRGRGSPLNRGNRNAVDPVNALLNYAYALLEAEALLACHEAGLDPYLGILHTDTEARRSLVYDVMEPVRPVADRLVLNLILSHAFRPGDLWALRDGRCRLDQDLCARLWSMMPEFRRALGPVMTFILSRLRRGPRYGEHTVFRLVEVAPLVRTRAPLGQKRWARPSPPPAIRAAGVCRSCGVLLEGQPARLYCDDCLNRRRKQVTDVHLRTATETLRHLRAEGQDPAHGRAAADARRQRLEQNKKAIREWTRVNVRPDPEEFRRTILPGLQHVTLRKIMQATGLCSGYVSMIRKGKYLPHPRHWNALGTLTQTRQEQ